MTAHEVDAELDRLLRAAAQEEAATLRDARRLAGAPGLDAVAAFVAKRERRRVLRRRVGLLVGAAAAALVALLALRNASGVGTAGPEIRLGGLELRCSAPTGEVSGFDVFRWEASAASSGWFEVTVLDPQSPDGPPLFRSSRMESSPWTPSADEASSWPDRILWQVRAYDRSGAFLGSSEASARRSRSD